MIIFYILLFLSIITYPLPSVRIGGQPIAIFLAIYALVYFFMNGFERRVDKSTFWPLWGLVFGFLISSFASNTFNLNFAINLIAFYVIFFVSANIAVDTESTPQIGSQYRLNTNPNIILNILILTGIILGIYGYYGYITGNVGTDSQYFWWSSARYWGIHYTESTRNADVHYIVFPFLAVLSKKKKSPLDVVLLIFFGLAMILSMARNTWICIAIVLIVYMVQQRGISGKLKYIVLAILFIIAGYYALQYFGMTDYFNGKLESIFSLQRTGNVSNSNSQRLEVVIFTFQTIFSHPLGVGAEHMAKYYRSDGLALNHAENTYLNITAEMGLIALISYAVIVFTPIKRIVKLKKTNQQDNNELSRGKSFALYAALYFALTILFNTETLNCYMWIVLGIIWFSMKAKSEDEVYL